MAAIDSSTATGVSFSLTDEQKELRALAREFAEKEMRPLEAECDVAMRHPVEVIEKAHETGLMNPHVPEEYGGAGLSVFDGMLMGEGGSTGAAPASGRRSQRTASDPAPSSASARTSRSGSG